MLNPISGASLDALRGKTVAVLGYGAQGAAHALNLRDGGVTVVVAQRQGSPRWDQAVDAGFSPISIAQAAEQADLLIFALPDDATPAIYKSEILPHQRSGQAFGFLHGFCVHYKLLDVPTTADVVLVAPKGQGRAVRSEFVAGRGVLALIAVAQNATGHAREIALAWAAGIGAARAAIFETTFAQETETDLFGEQAVLCGGLTALVRAGFDTLVEAGYPEELAYLECCHELKLIVDLIYELGISGMRERISTTARFGDLTRGPRIIDEHARAKMREALSDIRSGTFLHEFLAQSGAEAPRLADEDRSQAVDIVGERLRGLLRSP
ncbi:MAG: ketol-acid reductoisomerase [Phycisphaerae bacterium]